MNDDASTYELPDYIMSRIQPMIEISFPPREEELKILKYNIPFADQYLLGQTLDLLQKAHQSDLDCSTRDGIHILRYSMKRLAGNSALAKDQVWREAVERVIGSSPEQITGLAQKQRKKTKEKKFSDFSEFFMDPDFFRHDPNHEHFGDIEQDEHDDEDGDEPIAGG